LRLPVIFIAALLTLTALSGIHCSQSKEKKSQQAPAAQGYDFAPSNNVPPMPGPNPGGSFSSGNSQTGINVIGEPGKPQSVDLISGKPVNKYGLGYGDYNGQRVFFCCMVSKREFEKNVPGYLEAIKARDIILEKSPVQR
jgi:YHS domain-containing protein